MVSLTAADALRDRLQAPRSHEEQKEMCALQSRLEADLEQTIVHAIQAGAADLSLEDLLAEASNQPAGERPHRDIEFVFFSVWRSCAVCVVMQGLRRYMVPA